MLNLHHPDTSGAEILLKDINSTTPFYSGLEYSSPSRGVWTIAHISMLVPGSHQIFVCASGCLQGVVLSAAEYEGMDRYSMVALEENDILDGDLETLFIEGVTDIINKLPNTPTCVMPFTSCVHHFLATDLEYIYDVLNKRFPDIDFISCVMNPTMRKNEPPAEEVIKKQIYSAIRIRDKNPKSVNVVGISEPMNPESDNLDMMKNSGFTVHDICTCNTYDEYQQMGESILNIYSLPNGRLGAEALSERLGMKTLYMPFTYDYSEIRSNMKTLANILDTKLPDFDAQEQEAENALAAAFEKIGDMQIMLDYAASPRYFGLAKLLLEHGFNVTRIYADIINEDDLPALHWLKSHYPALPMRATVNYKSRFLARDDAEKCNGNLLAIGPRAAYFSGTTHFINMIEGHGLYGYKAIVKLAEEMCKAADVDSDVKSIIQVKGWGCTA